ncbi:CorA family divalent cation transporter [Rhodoferax sp. U11-2br]|uniref:CorA family divalent cation transporter n=1 Tax=Rhodoferax sp. U11-2br TaxID=2838878 RepID=UPI001BED2774|nr:CorA family divalent cation transporter [Rhodoferax sp. U11-2br]MBT3067205.1 magnesium transporter CorA [Rhodoferax sp. U11-2br]
MSVPAEKVSELLKKQKRIESLVHNQSMPRQAIVETLVQRQHLAELHNLLSPWPASEIGTILESLPVDEAMLLWAQLSAERQNDVLWEISDSLRGLLADNREPAFNESQINAFVLVDGRLRQIAVEGRKSLEGLQPIWIDLLGASKAERNFVGLHFGLSFSDPDDVTDLEASSRYRIEDNGDIHLHSNFLLDREGKSRSVPVSFVLHQGVLFTLRNQELPVFRLQRRRTLTQPGYVSDCTDVLLDLYGADVEYSADSLEDIYATLGEVGRQVLSEVITDREAAAILGDIAEEEDLNGRIRGNILDTQRAIHFLIRSKIMSTSQGEDARQILHNIESLNSHTSFLFDKINFLMDATIGFININQNRRINQLTVFGVVFTPINILAGMGGMSEFSMMTQGIPWPIAYGAFLGGAVLIGVITFLALKHLESRQTRVKRL